MNRKTFEIYENIIKCDPEDYPGMLMKLKLSPDMLTTEDLIDALTTFDTVDCCPAILRFIQFMYEDGFFRDILRELRLYIHNDHLYIGDRLYVGRVELNWYFAEIQMADYPLWREQQDLEAIHVARVVCWMLEDLYFS